MKSRKRKEIDCDLFMSPSLYVVRELFQLVLLTLTKIYNAEAGSIMFLNRGEDKLVMVETVGLSMDSRLNIQFKVGEGVAGTVFKAGKPIIVNDSTEYEKFKWFEFQRECVISLLCFPISNTQKVIGVINLTSSKPSTFENADISGLHHFSTLVVECIEKAHLDEHAESMEFLDEVTGLYNYSFFRENLERENSRSKRYGVVFSVVLLRIANFNEIIRKWDDAQVCQVLQLFSNHIKKTSRKVDICALYAHDTVAFILPETGKWGAKVKVDRLLEQIQGKMYMDKKTANLPPLVVKAGVASYPQDGDTETALLSCCESALS